MAGGCGGRVRTRTRSAPQYRSKRDKEEASLVGTQAAGEECSRRAKVAGVLLWVRQTQQRLCRLRQQKQLPFESTSSNPNRKWNYYLARLVTITGSADALSSGCTCARSAPTRDTWQRDDDTRATHRTDEFRKEANRSNTGRDQNKINQG